MMQEILGDITNTDCQLIAHGVNCQNVMGSGVAKAIATKYPEVKSKYHEHFDATPNTFPELRLGHVHFVFTDDKKIVANCFTQQNFGGDGQLYLSYTALKMCFDKLVDIMYKLQIDSIAIPRIGCGLAGGDWDTVKILIEQTFPPELTVKVYSI